MPAAGERHARDALALLLGARQAGRLGRLEGPDRGALALAGLLGLLDRLGLAGGPDGREGVVAEVVVGLVLLVFLELAELEAERVEVRAQVGVVVRVGLVVLRREREPPDRELDEGDPERPNVRLDGVRVARDALGLRKVGTGLATGTRASAGRD